MKNKYVLKHGYGPGTLPRDVEVLDYTEDKYNSYVVLNRALTEQELDFYDIKPGN